MYIKKNINGKICNFTILDEKYKNLLSVEKEDERFFLSDIER